MKTSILFASVLGLAACSDTKSVNEKDMTKIEAIGNQLLLIRQDSSHEDRTDTLSALKKAQELCNVKSFSRIPYQYECKYSTAGVWCRDIAETVVICEAGTIKQDRLKNK